MARKTHVQFKNIAHAAGATVSIGWVGAIKRRMSIAKFSTGPRPKLIFEVTYCDGEVGVHRPERGDLAIPWTLEDFEENFWLMHKVRQFIDQFREQ